MSATSIDIHDLSEGIDRKQLTLVKQRFLNLNRLRHERTCAALSERQQQFLQLLPLLFHVNHPMLPGYTSHTTPCGIYHYEPTKDEVRLAKSFARSFHHARDLLQSTTALDAIFVMGSIGTIAHSESSDLDIWLCHDPELTAAQLQELELKATRITHWAEQTIHLEIHCFLMNSRAFREGALSRLSSEDSGSAQHFLLLEEFYRTALWLAGKLPLWWFVPATQEQNYNSYSRQLLEKRFLREKDVIDFGGVPKIPYNEFIGAGIWQVYKGIDAPHKSVLKLVLLETYASDSDNEPLALTLKRAVYSDTPNGDQLDPYMMIYQRLEDYLLRRAQPQRLELIRRCFYFKVNKPLTKTRRREQKSWQRILLEYLIQQWGWQNHQLHLLDDQPLWKAETVMAERALLVNELSHSYRLMTEIDKEAYSHAAISNEELMILGRKLHAAFERKAGKIEWINPGISASLHEAALTVLQEQHNGDKHWLVLRGTHRELSLRQQAPQPIKRTRYLVELLLWCYCNGLLTANTKLDLISDDYQLSNNQRQNFLLTLQQWLPLPLPPAAHDKFKQSASPTHILLLFNLGIEPQAELHRKGLQMLSNQHDALGFSGFKENLVVTADIVQRNTWQEVVSRHYSGDALINSLLHYLRLLPVTADQPLPACTIRCFSAGLGAVISQRLEELWRDIISCYSAEMNSQRRNSRYLLEMGDEYLLIQFLQRQPQISRYKSYAKLLEKLARAQRHYSPLIIDRYALNDKPLKIISRTINGPGIYLFYQLDFSNQSQPCAQLSIVDQQGSLFSTSVNYYSQQTLLRPLCHFIERVVARSPLRAAKKPPADNLKIYEILPGAAHQQGYVVQDYSARNFSETSHAQQDYRQYGRNEHRTAEPRNASSEIQQVKFFNVTASAQPDAEGKLDYVIHCNGQGFFPSKTGQSCFVEVAKYIIAHRHQAARYPCYLTDLDLSQVADLIAPQTGLQLIHYLQVKQFIEQQINQALELV